jgi:hypothetical protein
LLDDQSVLHSVDIRTKGRYKYTETAVQVKSKIKQNHTKIEMRPRHTSYMCTPERKLRTRISVSSNKNPRSQEIVVLFQLYHTGIIFPFRKDLS